MKRTFIFILFILAFSAKGQTVITVAGTTDEAGQEDGAPFSAKFNQPHGIAIDHNDNSIYIADRSNHVIRKILPSGEVTTFAGTGNIGSQDGVGTNASFYDPWDVTVDLNGNVYVADQKNNKIRKITPNGLVTTLAGNGTFGFTDSPNGLAASFGNPSGVAVDKFGNVYVADHLNHLIRKISPAGAVTTLAGSRVNAPNNQGRQDGFGSAATLYRPYGLTVAPNGNIYVADEWNYLIRKITPAGQVTTVAGSGNVGSNDGSAMEASFNFPWDVSVDSLDNVFVADGFNHVIRKIDPSGQVTTYVGIAGTTGAIDGTAEQASFNAATGLAMNFNQNSLYITDSQNDLIRRIVPEVVPVPVPELTVDKNQICTGDSLGFSVSPSDFDSYNYYINGNLVETSGDAFLNVSDLPPGNYVAVVEASTSFGSQVSQSVSFSVLEGSVLTLNNTLGERLCDGDSTVISVDSIPGVSYLWSNGDTTNSIVVRESGTYYVQGITSNGCEATSDTLEVSFELLPEVDFDANPKSAALGEEVLFENLSSGAEFYRWNFGDPLSQADNFSTEENPVHSYDSTGAYTVSLEAFTASGCSAISTKTNFILVNFHPFIPTAFTPNGDGTNDLFYVRGGALQAFKLSIYNQWGELIFNSSDQDIGWDGTHRGALVESGTFVYVVVGTNSAGEDINLKGHITLIR